MKSEEILPLIHEAIVEVLPELDGHDFQETDSLDALGANSMDRAEIVMIVLEAMNLEIPLVDTFGPQNLGELARHLADKTAVAR
ncbi:MULTISPECIES: acyl carrier protein [Streptomyces]|uniref:Acyl carrier protein n=1 Tax=Streptomyces sp. NBC_00060 TaxID=2975636 RepID=A0AAU2H932_9ACTN|nr:acyl carrier protein [Streptomyces melanogenes]GGP81755.1 polyketide biosynthesis acyl-carrier-protein AcpK [Streptomyces melanogenes]